jgi:hypothetical protein
VSPQLPTVLAATGAAFALPPMVYALWDWARAKRRGQTNAKTAIEKPVTLNINTPGGQHLELSFPAGTSTDDVRLSLEKLEESSKTLPAATPPDDTAHPSGT